MPLTPPDLSDVAARFASDGFVGPFRFGSDGEMGMIALQLYRSVFNRPGPLAEDPFVDRHLDSPLVAHLSTHPAVLAVLEPLLGPDLVVWRSLFFAKGPQGREVPWHQDGHYWRLDPPITLTAWLAIDRAHSEDHCLEVVPGSHGQPLPHIAAPPGAQFPEMTDPRAVDPDRAVELPMDAGTFLVFDHRLVHRSRAGGRGRRLALSVRIAPAHVVVDPALLPPDGRVLSTRWRTETGQPGRAGPPPLPDGHPHA